MESEHGAFAIGVALAAAAAVHAVVYSEGGKGGALVAWWGRRCDLMARVGAQVHGEGGEGKGERRAQAR